MGNCSSVMFCIAKSRLCSAVMINILSLDELVEQQTISDLNITFGSTLFSCLLFMLPRSHAVYCRAFWLDHIFAIHSGFITGAVKSNV